MSRSEAPVRRMSRGARREQLLDAAADLVLADGAVALTIGRLADRAGVSRALLYQHVDDRDDLFVQLYEREREMFDERARLGALTARNVTELLQVLHGAYLDAVAERGALFVRLVGDPVPGGRLARVREMRQAETVSFWTDQIELAGVDPLDAATFAASFAAAALASGDLLLQGSPREVVEAHFYRLVGGTLAALTTGGPPQAARKPVPRTQSSRQDAG